MLSVLIKAVFSVLDVSADEYLSFAFERCSISSSKNKR